MTGGPATGADGSAAGAGGPVTGADGSVAGAGGSVAGAGADGGLQVERTVLAWRRTAASVVVAAAVGARFLLPHLGAWGFLAAVAASVLVVVIAVAALRRRVPPSAVPVAPEAAPQPARWLAAVALATSVGGLGVALALLAAGPAGQ